MNALLVVAHGSRRSLSNDEVVELAARLSVGCSDHYQIVHGAFLELAEPLIPDGIERCIDDGAKRIIVLPYFLNSGRHVAEDIPRIVNDSSNKYPDIEIKIAPHLGASEEMVSLLMAAAGAALDE